MKGIVLAGGSGTRLYPITLGVSKQLLPIYDKPMIYYPLSVLMLAKIREVLIITNPEYVNNYKAIFKDGEWLGMKIEYAIQDKPRGLADAFIVGRKFIGSDDTCLVLGDNIFYGHNLTTLLRKSKKTVENQDKAVVFGYYVNNPSDYGVVEFDENQKAISIEEKPQYPKSNYAVVGLYFYPNDVVDKAKEIKPSKRGELEITSINEMYLKEDRLQVELMGRGYAWLDTGTHENLIEAGMFVKTIEQRQGLKIACIEEIAYRNGWIDKNQLEYIARTFMKSGYGEYLLKIVDS